jgi:hypothetical protein
MPLALSQPTRTAGARPPVEAGRKRGAVAMALVWQALHEDPHCPSRGLRATVAQSPAPLQRSVRPRNRLRVTWPLRRRTGRPRRAAHSPPRPSCTAVGRGTPRLSCVGVPLLAHGLEHQGACGPVVPQRHQAIQTSKATQPEEDCALVPHHQQTLLRRVQALVVAPLCGSKTLTGCETPAPPLPPRVGRGYHRATLLQCLGHRERVEAAPALRPPVVPGHPGPITAVEGPRSASGSRWSMHTGTSTLLGRILGGSQAVSAHDTAGDAVCVPSSPPARPLAPLRVACCQQGAVAPGNARCVIDRAVHAVALAQACDPQGLGVRWMLADHEPAGLARCAAPAGAPVQDGATVSSGPWPVPRPEDPRHCGIVAPPAGKPLGDWGTPTGKATVEPITWPRGDRARRERQDNRVKRMRAPGALTTNAGRKNIVGPDRQQQRARAQRAPSRAVAQTRVDQKVEAHQAPQDTVAASTSPGQSTRLAQRQRALVRGEKARQDAQDTRDHRAEHAAAWGPPRERADRDLRTPRRMTVRTLLLEHALRSCMAVR